ncbi:hypothetical protein K6M90_09910 [Rhizobium sp. 9T]|uniref:hypothetical protein n=1 Tax=Rhizobium croatiense TaxID=2867516 RepID=UPI001C935598|nr:hypothetical protein [Rhizobium croatiense]MBY4607965.1 hypothetical protein [Rhizobium croatiense]
MDAGLHDGGWGNVASHHANSLLPPAVLPDTVSQFSAHIVDEDPPIDMARSFGSPVKSAGALIGLFSCKAHR